MNNQISSEKFTGDCYQIPHHRCHAASAAYCSGFNEQVTITLDRAGEDESTVLWDEHLNRTKEFAKTNSIGKFYSAGCNYLGFRGFKDAGKVMGLAPYGEYRDDFAEAFGEVVQ